MAYAHCVRQHERRYRKIPNIPESESLSQASWWSLLVSRKGGKSDLTSEARLNDEVGQGSETTNSGTDKQERHTEATWSG